MPLFTAYKDSANCNKNTNKEASFLVIIVEMQELPDTITFLGTAGARFMVTKQFLASGGAWLNLGGTEIVLDPSKLNAIILSHKHLDHSVDINIMIEAMTEGGRKQQGIVFAPSDALNQSAVILPYLQSYPQRIDVLSEGKSYSIGDIQFETPIRHHHGVETYGFVFRTPRYTFSWITDTKYFANLPGYYRAELLIINVLILDPKGLVDHLSLPEARQIIEEVRPKAAILTHFGTSMWRAKPRKLAMQLSKDIGIPVIAARDGMKFDLAELEVL